MLTIPPVPLKGDITDHGSGRRVNFSKGHPCGQLRCAQRVTRRFFFGRTVLGNGWNSWKSIGSLIRVKHQKWGIASSYVDMLICWYVDMLIRRKIRWFWLILHCMEWGTLISGKPIWLEGLTGQWWISSGNQTWFAGRPARLVGGFKHVLFSIIYGIILPID